MCMEFIEMQLRDLESLLDQPYNFADTLLLHEMEIQGDDVLSNLGVW